MSLQDLLQISGAVLLSLGGGAAIVWALAKWLGGVWAGRILENERAASSREHELLVRRRNVYAKLAQSMRIFLSSDPPATDQDKKAFLAAYDEAALWAVEPVMAEVGKFLDMLVVHIAGKPHMNDQALRASNEALCAEYAHCITVMRRDCGFPETGYAHRIVSF